MNSIWCFFFILRICSVWGNRYDAEWKNHKVTHGKTYATDQEEQYRKTVYQNNMQCNADWNARFARGEVTFTRTENKYSDLTNEEFKKLTGLLVAETFEQLNNSESPSEFLATSIHKQLGENHYSCSTDLREDYCLGAVKDQGQCGSCFAFPAAAMLEFAYCKNRGRPISFSEQQCLDCTKGKYGNDGCNGGYYEGCLKYWMRNKIMKTVHYPYKAKEGVCKNRPFLGVKRALGFISLPKWDELGMEIVFCSFKIPIAIAIDATENFQHYGSGVFDDPICSNFYKNGSTYANHAITIVGTGSEPDGTDYWLVRNSWGTSWGEGGYIKMKRGKNMCNLAMEPVIAFI